MNRQNIVERFRAYTDAYNSQDEKIRLKIEHTFYVAELSDTIAQSLGLSRKDQDLAWLIGMLHDIGRFEQVTRYQTFQDAISVDHAQFGADLLFKEGLIQDYSQALSAEELGLIELAIRQHNKYRICEGLSPREQCFCNIIRDADKIDILRVNVQTPMEVIYGVSKEALRQSTISPEVLQCFRERHTVLRALKKTPVDNLVGHITLVFELVYSKSRSLVKEQGYLDQMLNFQSEHPKTQKAFRKMKAAMHQWLEDPHGRLKKLVLLHSNDIHGDFLAERVDKKLVGGVSMLSGYISKVREEEPNTIYCIAGDMIKGSIIDAEYSGVSTIEIMNALAPDIAIPGNHEVDYGTAHLLFLEKCANFPIINANLYISMNHSRMFEPCKILEIGGMRILFIGILTEDVLSTTKKEPLIGTMLECSDPVEEIGKICNAYNALDVDFTVLLTHIGFEEDKKLAARLNPDWGVDVIIGGHSHTLPNEPACVNGIHIVQAGTGTDQIGRFDIMVDTEKNCIHSFTWKTVPIEPKTCPPDQKLEALILDYKETTDLKYNRVLTRLARKLSHPGRCLETEVGDLVADALKDSLGLDIMLVGSGTLRMPSLGTVVTYRDFVEMFAFDDPVYMVTVTGKQLRSMIHYMCRDEVWTGAHTEFYQFSEGLEVIYSKSRHEFERFNFQGQPLEDQRLLTVGLQGYHYNNFSQIFNLPMEEVVANGKPRQLSTSVNQILEEYFTANQLLNSLGVGRLVIKE